MGELTRLLEVSADYIERLLIDNHEAQEDLLLLRQAGQEPNVFRVLEHDIGLLIRFQGLPE